MLLYTKLAPPKVPKKRSRAGCAFCRDKKKKCDEIRPTCSRCEERGIECVYEGVKPRQRHSKSETCKGTKQTDAESALSPRGGEQLPGRILGSDTGALSPGLIPYDSYKSPAWRPFDEPSPLEPNFPVSSPAFSAPDYLTHEPEQDAEDQAFSDKVGTLRRGYSMDAGAIVPYSSPRTSQYPDLAMIAPCPTISPLLEFNAPAFSEFTNRANRRALLNHFCNTMSHLIVLDEGAGEYQVGNPFQQLVLPLADKSPSVMNAVFALAGAHLEHRGIEGGEKALSFHQQAVQGLARMIELGEGQVDRNEMLASIMLLVYYEVLVQKGRSNIVDGHLKGALTIMHDRTAWASNSATPDPTSAFLETAFRFFDVITALSHGNSPLTPAPAAGQTYQPPLPAVPIAIDALLGMAATLWPVIHRLASLAPLKRELAAAKSDSPKAAVLRTEFITTASAVEAALLSWTPPIIPPPFEPDQDEATVVDVDAKPGTEHVETVKPQSNPDGDDVEATITSPLPMPIPLFTVAHNALAYRHAALTHLYRITLPQPSSTPTSASSPIRHHARLTLEHCVAAAAHAGPMGALLWPLFVGACEAVGPRERGLARRAFGAVEARQGMVNIGQAWEIVLETWRRVDEGRRESEGEEGVVEVWRRVGRDMGVDIVFG